MKQQRGKSRRRAWHIGQFLVAACVIVVTFGAGREVTAYGMSSELSAALQGRLGSGATVHTASGTSLKSPAAVAQYYAEREYQPIWTKRRGVSRQAKDLLGVIRNADREGLTPDTYHLFALEQYMGSDNQLSRKQSTLDLSQLIDLELLLSDAFLTYARHLQSGQVDPRQLDQLWFIHPETADFGGLLDKASKSGRLEKLLDRLVPSDARYAQLREQLAVYRDLAARGGWNPIPSGKKLQPGDSGPRVAALIERLNVTGELGGVVGTMYDATVEQGVKDFQVTHSLTPDGAVGKGTLAELNIPIAQRIRQIELNLDRLRMLPRDFGERYVLVNIPSFRLNVIDQEKPELTMNVVVGKQTQRTPIMTGTMTHLILNPEWNVPSSITQKEMLPKVRENPEYLQKKNFQIITAKGTELPRNEAGEIDWDQVQPGQIRLRQKPGGGNALGNIKFMFPNPHSVYLHDTPSRSLFTREVRAFSHGCVRVHHPHELAETVLRDDPEWTAERIKKITAGVGQRRVDLPQALPVYLVYLTAWVDHNGQLHFARDIYGYDKGLDRALQTVASR